VTVTGFRGFREFRFLGRPIVNYVIVSRCCGGWRSHRQRCRCLGVYAMTTPSTLSTTSTTVVATSLTSLSQLSWITWRQCLRPRRRRHSHRVVDGSSYWTSSPTIWRSSTCRHHPHRNDIVVVSLSKSTSWWQLIILDAVGSHILPVPRCTRRLLPTPQKVYILWLVRCFVTPSRVNY